MRQLATPLLFTICAFIAGCATNAIVFMPPSVDIAFTPRVDRLVSVEMRMPSNRLHRVPGGENYLFMWRAEIESFVRDKRIFEGKSERAVRLVMNPVVFEETGAMSNVRIVMDYSVVDEKSGFVIEHYLVESRGYSATFDGSIRTRRAWEAATQANIRDFITQFARQESSLRETPNKAPEATGSTGSPQAR